MKTLLPAAAMRALVDVVMTDLAPVCERLAVAGSLRREKPECGDVELVAIPRFEPYGLFGDEQLNSLWRHLSTSPVYTFTKGDKPDGKYFQVRYEGVQLDIFTAEHGSWGWCLLMRTGSAGFSHSILTEWKRQKCIGRDQQGSRGGYLIDRYGQVAVTPEEQTVFDLLGLPYIEPRDRSDDALMRVRARR